jgi:cobalt-zinc-cadmium efflux system outer membrane protein
MSVAHGSRARFSARFAAIVLAAALVWPARALAQSDLDSLVALATASSPALRAARARVDAARMRIGPAGARPDPMLMAGVQNFPVTDPGFADFMTMKMIGVGQTLPFPGKLLLRTLAAEYEVAAATARLEAARLTVAREVRSAYYDLLFADQAFDIVRRNQEMLTALVSVSEAHYSSGTGNQADVLRLRVEAARLADEATVLAEGRRATVARLNAALSQPSDAGVAVPTLPERIAGLAVRDSATRIAFVSSALGSRVADSPIPSVDSLQAIANRHNPSLRAHEAMIAAQAARVELARKEHLPDFDVSVQYGQRDGFSDMVTATVSIPLPLQKGRKQDAQLAEARSELAALEAEHHTMRNELAAKVVELHSALERGRSQLALYVKAILPQARATLSTASAGYQVGRVEFISLLEAQAALFEYETQYHRALTDFAKTLALLEEQVGAEVVR